MAGTYASATDVSTSKSRQEVERTLERFGATAFAYMSDNEGNVAISFEIQHYRVLMRMRLPARELFTLTSTGKQRPESAIQKEWEQACRQRWRSMANGIKAKLAMIDDGISTLEREFLADIVLPNGGTVGDSMIPQLERALDSGELPKLVPTITVE